jgi:ATP-binding cassette subfamily B protein
MLSVSYIIGELNSPINRLISFFRSLQDAQLSFSRLNEIHSQSLDLIEEGIENPTVTNQDSLVFKNVSFQYNGPRSPFALKDINLEIPHNKITAIVGASGSGKTTLIKLLLKYDNPTTGEIHIGETNILDFPLKSWRDHFGIVMQDGKVFSETIERNIATCDEEIDQDRLMRAVEVANLAEFLENLPLGLKTKIGDTGIGVSGGQKQRLLIARSVYKNSNFLFFDEATSSLDSENETVIMERLNSLFHDKTVVIVAHRLSTVKNADQIIVLDKGSIVEVGNHNNLVGNRSKYYNLVKNQLDLGD